jgi:hypothetical protein
MYTKLYKNRPADPPPLTPREVCHRYSRLGKVGVVAGGGMPARASEELTSRACGICCHMRASQI